MAVVHMAGIESVETAKEKLGNALLAAKAGKLLKTAGLWDNPPDAMPWKGILSALHGPPRSRCLPKEVWELRSPIKMVALPNWTWENEEETRVSPEVFDTLCKKKGMNPQDLQVFLAVSTNAIYRRLKTLGPGRRGFTTWWKISRAQSVSSAECDH